MILNIFYYLLFIRLVVIRNSDISKQCVCGHVQSQNECKNSGICIWEKDQCILNSMKSYKVEVNNQNPCRNYSQKDCREQEQCGFYFGQCMDFIDCSIFDKDNCQESSYKCVSDGSKLCEQKLEWQVLFLDCGDREKCTNVTMCEELPIYLTNHSMCKEGLEGCTVSQKGYGCIKQMESCSQYFNNFQCFESKSRKDNCFWDSTRGKCIEKECENLPFTQDYEGKTYLSDCTTNGIHCVKRLQCIDAENKFGCVTDAQGKKCEYHQNQCKIKSCYTAPDSYKTYQQCQDYDNLLDCVTSQNKGCKNRPETCYGYDYEIDCYSIEQQDCIWHNDKCEQRQCYHAPIDYSPKECHQYGNCIGQLNGGCQKTPQLCEEILEEEFCEFNYNKERCIWLEGQCVLLECKKLKLPYYKNHNICQKASQFCTFNSDSFGCADYLCENIGEKEFCTIDSTNTVCVLNSVCIEKQCKTAPPSYDTNQKCEGWMPKCTVNVQLVSDSKILIGCVDKKSSCLLSTQDQCFTTLSGLNCKWDGGSQRCIDQEFSDADPNLHLKNDDCKSFKVFVGPCIIGSSGFGCIKWSDNCNEMISQQQCQLNLQDGTKCFWTGAYCKKQQCLDAPKNNYTNNVQCNTWLNNCIFDHIFGGCKDRPNHIACSSFPNMSIYITHQECFAWNPKCTVISSFIAEGCELKKASCYEFIRERNCKKNINGQICYWDDKEQSCMHEDEDDNGIADCHKRLYGDLTHQDCENFMPKCTLNNIVKSCSNLSYYCDYQQKQQCEITIYQQPCKWDYFNYKCKEVDCIDNITAQTEAECLRFRKNNECQLIIKSNGAYGPGCEKRPTSCGQITDSVICKLTLTLFNDRCYYFNSLCQKVQSHQCEAITESKSNDFCQLYNTDCALQSSGQGCYSFQDCAYLSNNVCNNAIMRQNLKCHLQDKCRYDDTCSNKYLSYSNCDGKKTYFGQLCQYVYQCNSITCSYYCLEQTAQMNLTFQSFSTLSEKREQCQNYSSSYKYDTTCDCCVLLTECSFQVGSQSLCNSSITESQTQCGYNQQTNTCKERRCEHLTSNQVISQLTCFNWKYNCVYDVTGCKTFSGDCTTIVFIQQCYSNSCQWQEGNCVNNVNCDLNTTAVTNHECLLINSRYCRLNYTKGQGCAFTDCNVITSSNICISAQVVDGQKCKWLSDINQCTNKQCSEFTIQSDCENSYGYISTTVTKCYWCSLYTSQCSNHSYCNSNCNSVNVLSTIQFTISNKCTVKLQRCSDYTYQEACEKTIDGLDCYWYSNVCLNICEAAIYLISSHTNSSCHSFNASCMQLNSYECNILDCYSLITSADCAIFTEKCFWDGSICQSLGDCSKYSTSTLCLNNINSQGIPCFWNDTQCLEKTCSNKPSPSQNQSECDSWLVNCQWNINNNQCMEDCTQTNISNNTHQLCESFHLNQSCTVKLDLIQCVDLPLSCPLAKKTQCYLDQNGNECYYQLSSGQCVNLTCSNLPISFQNHEKCNQSLKSCTVNETLNGCQQLNECSKYSIQEQCQIDSNNIECEWIISENKCTIKKCTTAQLKIYSAHSCQQYFGDSCTVNANFNGCEISQALCMKYTNTQCQSEGQKNLSGVNCFWNEDKSICLERICENGPSLAQSHSDCEGFLSTCQKGGCRTKNCFDYNYSLDSACASIFEDKRCVTNGYQCVLRKSCEDVATIDGCTFDINLHPCVWIDEKCYTKTCLTAQVQFITHQECNSYLSICTVKQDGGCTQKQNCSDYQIKEACQTDSENFECIWDINLQKCFSSQCVNFCGDGIVTSQNEQCDDGNDIPYDGCYQCEFQCSEGCIECLLSQCQKCDEYYTLDIQTTKCLKEKNYFDDNDLDIEIQKLQSYTNLRCGENQKLIDHLCVNQCGNGVLINQYEECDDGNNYGGDGCSTYCNIEDSYQCISQQSSLSLCTFIKAPEFNLKIVSDNMKQNQIVELTFTELVKMKDSLNFEQLIVFTIIPQTRYQLTISTISNLTTTLSYPKYLVQIEFIEPTQNPILQVDIHENSIFNSYELVLQKNQKTINLETPFVLSGTTKQQLISIVQLNDAMMYSLAGVSSLALVTGNPIILFNLLDLLQSLSYLRFMQYKFPPHLYAFLNTYTKISLQPIFNYFHIDQFLTNLNQGQKQNQIDETSYQDTINILKQMYLLNVKSCYFSVFASILAYMTCNILVSNFFFNIVDKITYRYQDNLKILKLINKFQKTIQKNCLLFKIEYFSLGVFKVFQAILHQTIFSLLIEFPNYPFNSPIEIFSSVNAVFGLLFLLKTIYPFFSITSTQIKNYNKWKYFFYESKSPFWAAQYKSFQIFRVIFFILIIVKLINYPEAQSILISMQSTFFGIYLIRFQPLKSKFELSKIIFKEFLLMLITGTFLLYSFQFSQDHLIIIGWVHIGLFCTILALNLFLDLLQQILKVYNSYLKQKQKKIFEEERKQYFNQLQEFPINNNNYKK
ncbi:unnamed protein product [Paramecium pentaurelia]|uniref:Uncharacterized protein n=1 Tax=Paramecium pentaurelia TaxID=43138 RepID=A0A8S1TK50_9CILI|nr:unnamed protein product [Paramecium pentaurelia]